MKSIKEKALQIYTSPACGQFGTGDYEGPEFDIDGFNDFMKGANYVLDAITQCMPKTHSFNPNEVIDVIASMIKELKK